MSFFLMQTTLLYSVELSVYFLCLKSGSWISQDLRILSAVSMSVPCCAQDTIHMIHFLLNKIQSKWYSYQYEIHSLQMA